MKEKLTTMERRAKNWSEHARLNGPCAFTMEWKKSATWGLCPSIAFKADKASHASGCGYDKESACLADFLRFLCPSAWACHGSGFSSVVKACEKDGWKLEKTYEGKTEHGYTISKI